MRQGGFTLIELLMVILVIGILSGMVVPMVLSTQDAQCSSAARVLTSDLELAQSIALARQAEVALVFSADLQSYKVALAQGQTLTSYASVTPMESPNQPGRLYEVCFADQGELPDVQVSAVDFAGGHYVVFDTFGSPDVGGMVTIDAGDASLTVTLEPITGAVTID